MRFAAVAATSNLERTKRRGKEKEEGSLKFWLGKYETYSRLWAEGAGSFFF